MKCAFCLKPGDDLAYLIEGRSSAMICDECVDKAVELVKELRGPDYKPKRKRKSKKAEAGAAVLEAAE